MLAMYVCFDNPSPMVVDYPTAYMAQSGFEFLRQVPTWWDETRVLVAEVGRRLVTARRKGPVWYLGGMSAGEPRELDLPLTFLPAGRFSARIWQDAPGAAADPNLLDSETQTVSVADRFRLWFARDGGFVAELRPAAD
jgi:alpha-glucosidase